MSEDRERQELWRSLDEVLVFNDPALDDEEFKRELCQRIREDLPEIRSGTNDDLTLISCSKRASGAVDEAIRACGGMQDRNRIVTEAYNRCSFAKPNGRYLYRPSRFLEGSDYERWAKTVHKTTP